FEIRKPARLPEATKRSTLHGIEHRVARTMAADDDGCRDEFKSLEALEELEPIHDRHVQIDKGHIEVPLPREDERLFAVLGCSGAVAEVREMLSDGREEVLLVVNDEELARKDGREPRGDLAAHNAVAPDEQDSIALGHGSSPMAVR